MLPKYTEQFLKDYCINNNYTILDYKLRGKSTKLLSFEIQCNSCCRIRKTKHPSDLDRNQMCVGCLAIKRAKYTKYDIELLCNKLNYKIEHFEFFNNSPSFPILKLSCKSCNRIREIDYVENLNKYPNCTYCYTKGKVIKSTRTKNVSIKYSIEYIKQICLNKGFIFLDTNYINKNQKYNILCPNNHKILKNIQAFLSDKQLCESFCNECHNSRIDSVLKDKQISFVDKPNKTNLNDYFTFKCLKCENTWDSTLVNILKDTRCRNCNKNPNYKNANITQKYIMEILPESIISQELYIKTNIPYKYGIQKAVYIDYVINYKDKIYYVEYNGAQHYKPINFGSGRDNKTFLQNFERQQARDAWLRQHCLDNNITLIEIDGRKYKGESIKDYLISQIKKADNI